MDDVQMTSHIHTVSERMRMRPSSAHKLSTFPIAL